MISIRKFVGYTGAAAGIMAAIALAASAQTAVAAAPWNQSPATEATVSPQCTAAFQDIKAAAAADRSEDATERAVAKTNPDLTADRAEDSTERAPPPRRSGCSSRHWRRRRVPHAEAGPSTARGRCSGQV